MKKDEVKYRKLIKRLGERIRLVRKKCGQSISGAAEGMGITSFQLWKLEAGGYPHVRLGFLWDLCEYYGVSLDEILQKD
ncbi:helix-turn-helix domain-containing protein [Chitinophaga sp. Hz27]|uniref:helix-turn-helix domain-containing protein n=1 Tax=Chitinophaga sp. Hz27 TaxID=3347169 RepID=UPI0035D72FEF